MDAFEPDVGTQPFEIDEAGIRDEFSGKEKIYAALANEARFILDTKLEERSIKIHDIEVRVKKIDSIIKKCKEKKISNPISEMSDIVDLRIICLFRSDINNIDILIKDNFQIHKIDDKINESTDSFGYMSIHYDTELQSEFSGTRYDKVKGICFEIQVRTISMHAWAVISHYLSYKGEWDVPDQLKKSLNALSGLFYLADGEFERFFNESEKSRLLAGTLVANEEINFDTISALLAEIFPDRSRPEPRVISDLVQQIKEAEYTKISEVKKDIVGVSLIFKQFLKNNVAKGDDDNFSQVAAARISLSISNLDFFKLERKGRKLDDHYKKYRSQNQIAR
jgi:putative GTP pyrophosphokinase